METFIRVYENAASTSLCQRVIGVFDLISTKKNNVQINKWANNIKRNDASIFLQEHNVSELINELSGCLTNCLNFYREEFGHINDLFLTTKNCYKVQKTMPYGGYHIWHYEQLANDQDSHNRELVWTLYLNTMPDYEAETEFLYQKTKVQPKEGSICIFPAAMTHLHRGLTVYSYPKYIATGWYYIKE